MSPTVLKICITIFAFSFICPPSYAKQNNNLEELTWLANQTDQWINQKGTASSNQKSIQQISELYYSRDQNHFVSKAPEFYYHYANNDPHALDHLTEWLIKNGMFTELDRHFSKYPESLRQLDTLKYLLEIGGSAYDKEWYLNTLLKIYQNITFNNSTDLDHFTIQLARAYFENSKFSTAKQILSKLSPDSIYVPWKEYLLALIAVQEGLIQVAAKSLMKICFEYATFKPLINAACLSYGKTMATIGNMENAAYSLERVMGDSIYYKQALYDLTWLNIQQSFFELAIDNASSWLSLYRYQENSRDIERALALSLAKQKKIKLALKNYESLASRTTRDIREIDQLIKRYRGKYGEIIRLISSTRIPYSTSDTYHQLLSDSHITKLINLQKTINLLEQELKLMRQRSILMKLYCANKSRLPSPNHVNQLSQGFLLQRLIWSIGTKLYKERIDFPFAKLLVPSQQINNLLNLKKDTRHLNDRKRNFINVLVERSSYQIGERQLSFEDSLFILADLEQRMLTGDTNQQITVLKNRFITLENYPERLNTWSNTLEPPLFNPETLDKKIRAQVTPFNELLTKIQKQANKLHPIPTIAVKPINKDVKKVQKHLVALTKLHDTLAKRFLSLSNQILPSKLHALRLNLHKQQTEIKWGMINTKHAYLTGLKEELLDSTAVRFDTMQKLNKTMVIH